MIGVTDKQIVLGLLALVPVFSALVGAIAGMSIERVKWKDAMQCTDPELIMRLRSEMGDGKTFEVVPL